MMLLLCTSRGFPWLFCFMAPIIHVIAALVLVGCSTRFEPAVAQQSSGPSKAAEESKALQSAAVGTNVKNKETSHFDLTDLWLKEELGQTVVHMQFSRPVTQYRHFLLNQPSRIVVDILGVSNAVTKSETFTVGSNLVGMLRFTSGEELVRVVIDVAAATSPPYVIESESGGLKMIIGSANQKATVKKEIRLLDHGTRVIAQPGPVQIKQYPGPQILLDFQDVEIRQIFGLLAELGAKNVLVTEDVKKRITIKLKEPIPWEQALDLLIETNGLGKEEVGNVIRISTLSQFTQERNSRATAEKAKELEGPIQTAYLKVNYARVKDLAERMQKIKSPAGQILPDEQTNSIFVRDIRRVVEEAKAIVSNFDIRVPQVLIESNLIETTPTFARALGVEFAFTRGGTTFDSRLPAGAPFVSPPGTPENPPLGVTLSVIQNRLGGLTNLNATLSAAEDEGKVKIISRPSVMTLNNVESKIESTRNLRVALPQGTSTTAVGTTGSLASQVATEKIPVGITLSVTPQVATDGFILMRINVVSSSLGTRSPGAAVPDELRREANANVLIRDGETVVIGGIMKDSQDESESGIPYLKDIPVLGWLFKRTRFQKDFEELMVFITPRIVSSGSSDLPTAEEMWRRYLKNTEGRENPVGSATP